MIETFISVPLCCSSWLVQLLEYLGCLSLAYYCWCVRECVVSQRKILPILSVFLTKLPLGCTHIHAECDTDADLFHFGKYSTSNRCKVPELGKVQLEIIKHKRQSQERACPSDNVIWIAIIKLLWLHKLLSDSFY